MAIKDRNNKKGKNSKKTKKPERISFEAKMWIGLGIFMVVSFGFLIFAVSAAGASFLNSDIWYYCQRSLLTVLFVFLAFYKRKERVPLYSTIFLIGYVVLLWLGTFLFSIREEVLSDFLWAIIATIASIVAYTKMKYKDERTMCRLDFAIILVLLSNMSFLLYISHIDNNAFLLQSVIVGTTAFVVSVILVIFLKDKIAERQNIIWIPLCFLLFVTVFAYMSLTTLNFCLDNSTPVIQNVEVLDKEIRSSSRGPTTFEIKVKIDNKKIYITIPSDIFHNIDKGDFVSISTYKGAFNVPYYFYENVIQAE